MRFFIAVKPYLWQSWIVNLSSNIAIAIAIAVICAIAIYLYQRQSDLFKDSLLLAVFILGCGIGYFSRGNIKQLNPELSAWLELIIAASFWLVAIALIFRLWQIYNLPYLASTNRSPLTAIDESQQLLNVIRQQKQFIKNIYEDVREAIFVVNVTDKGEFYYQGFNPAARKLTGINDVVDKTPDQIFAPEVADEIKRHYNQCLESKVSITYEECLSIDGRDTWWLTSLNPVEDESGNIYRLVGTSLNISDRKQAELELDRDKNFVRTLLDNLSDGIVFCDRDGVISLFNSATRKFHGLPQQAIPSQQWAEHYDLYLPDGKTKMSKQDIPLFRALKGESVRDVEMMIIPKQGKARTLLANGDPIVDSNGEKIGALVAMRDITERQQAEAELNRERVFIKTLLDNLSDGIVACDAEGTLALFNKASSEFFPVPFKPVPHKEWAQYYSLYDAVGENYLQLEDIPLFRAFSGESFTDVELMTIAPQGNARTLLANGSPIIDRQGNKLGAVVAIRDITARKRAEREIALLNNELEARVKQRTAQLEQRNRELDEFAYATSHDLKAPLRAIANLSEWIEEDLAGKLDEDTQHQMNLLRSRVHRLENFIDALLNYSRVGRLESEPQEVSVGQMLSEIIDSLNVPEHFQVKIKGQMPTLTTQLVPLQQVFSNLINNAIAHSDCAEGRITISTIEKDDCYEFSVADNGKGIDPKYQDRIFTIFQTLESRDKKESTGIGLAIVKKAVENQGGRVTVESELGKGATFSFTWSKTE